jgi:hypothetical protein
VGRQGKHAQAFLTRTPSEPATFWTNHQLFMTSLSKAACEQQELPLATPQLFTGVDVHHLHSYHPPLVVSG